MEAQWGGVGAFLEGRLETIREGRRLIEEGLHGAYRRRVGSFLERE